MRTLTLQSLAEGLLNWGERRAVGLRGDLGLRWWTYRQLHGSTRAVAAFLSERGLAAGERIILWAPSCPEWVGVLLGAALRGVVVVPADDFAPPEKVRWLARKVEARWLFHGRSQDASAVPELPRFALEELDELPGAPPHDDLGAPVEPSSPAVIYFTSGTTSTPRGVVLTHGNLMSQVERFRRWRPLVRLVPFRLLTLAPLSHSQGLLLGLCVPLSTGLSVFYTHAYHPGHLLRCLRDDRVTLLSTVPRPLTLLSRALLERPYYRSGHTLGGKLAAVPRVWERPGPWGRFLRRHYIFTAFRWRGVGYRFWVILVGGARLPRSDEELWKDTGCLLVQGYGLTETAAILSVNTPWRGRTGSIGTPLAHQEVRLAEDGEVLVRGPNVTPGYFAEGREEPGSVGKDGFLRTGDLARRDHRDRLYFLGRKKDLIVTGEGFNIHPSEVEEALLLQPGVRDGVALGLEHDGHEEVHAVLLLAPGPRAEEVVEGANRQLAAHQRIRAFTVWPGPDFPRSPLLKVRRREVAEAVRRQRAAADSLSAAVSPGAPPTLAEVRAARSKGQRLDLLVRHLLETDPGELESHPLRLADDLGLSSLDVVEVLFRLEQRAQISLQDLEVEGSTTLAELRRAALAPSAATPRPSRLHRLQPPRWAAAAWLAPLRRYALAPLLGAWISLLARVEVEGREHLEGVEGPVILLGLGHQHGLDVLALQRALPRGRRHRLMLTTGRWVFSDYLDPEPDISPLVTAFMGLAFHLLVPLAFPFALLPPFGSAREGLLETCRLLDRGYSPVVFEGRGTARIACECRVPIVPFYLAGNDDLSFRPRRPRRRLRVRFAAPIGVRAGDGPEAVEGRLAHHLADFERFPFEAEPETAQRRGA